MGSKINVNINNEWEPKVRPILDRWKAEEGNFSDKICEAIVFLETATAEKIYEAIMQYDYREQMVLERKTKLAVRAGKDPIHYLTEAEYGPKITRELALVITKNVRKQIRQEEIRMSSENGRSSSTTTLTGVK